MPAWFPTREPIHGHASYPPTLLPPGFSEWGLSHISHAWNGSPQVDSTQPESAASPAPPRPPPGEPKLEILADTEGFGFEAGDKLPSLSAWLCDPPSGDTLALIQLAWAHPTSSHWKAQGENQATSRRDSVADRWRLTSQSLSPFTELLPALNKRKPTFIHSFAPYIHTQVQ